jgi:hypothetical protein
LGVIIQAKDPECDLSDRERLLAEAAQARRLARNVQDPRFIAMLETLAERLERQAAATVPRVPAAPSADGGKI